ncbi:MAG TPA: hypothetical protein VHM90_00790, partial [Phycisphaerae bacterium]|nr:hypothetical protein [Phycisphaerae bacterium]
ALALQKLGKADQAKALYQQLTDSGARMIAATPLPSDPAVVPVATRWAIADAHYLAALGNLGSANTVKAKEELAAALKIAPDHLAAQVALSQLK